VQTVLGSPQLHYYGGKREMSAAKFQQHSSIRDLIFRVEISRNFNYIVYCHNIAPLAHERAVRTELGVRLAPAPDDSIPVSTTTHFV